VEVGCVRACGCACEHGRACDGGVGAYMSAGI